MRAKVIQFSIITLIIISFFGCCPKEKEINKIEDLIYTEKTKLRQEHKEKFECFKDSIDFSIKNDTLINNVKQYINIENMLLVEFNEFGNNLILQMRACEKDIDFNKELNKKIRLIHKKQDSILSLININYNVYKIQNQ